MIPSILETFWDQSSWLAVVLHACKSPLHHLIQIPKNVKSQSRFSSFQHNMYVYATFCFSPHLRIHKLLLNFQHHRFLKIIYCLLISSSGFNDCPCYLEFTTTQLCRSPQGLRGSVERYETGRTKFMLQPNFIPFKLEARTLFQLTNQVGSFIYRYIDFYLATVIISMEMYSIQCQERKENTKRKHKINTVVGGFVVFIATPQ